MHIWIDIFWLYIYAYMHIAKKTYGLPAEIFGLPHNHTLFTYMNIYQMSCRVPFSSCPIITIWSMNLPFILLDLFLCVTSKSHSGHTHILSKWIHFWWTGRWRFWVATQSHSEHCNFSPIWTHYRWVAGWLFHNLNNESLTNMNIFLMFCKIILSDCWIITMWAVNIWIHMNKYLMSCQVTIMSSLTITILALRHLINVNTICS